ncbi:MAG TPA: aminotransferase class III-fold pyridoxal phosphate-dependent enzyme, partial [Candidatus Dormibacteraeota bacterium]
IERDGLVGHAAEMGEMLNAAIHELGGKEVRGLGLMQAVEFAEPRAKAFQGACLEARLVVNAVDDNSIRFVPPLIITAEQIDRAQHTMQAALK